MSIPRLDVAPVRWRDGRVKTLLLTVLLIAAGAAQAADAPASTDLSGVTVEVPKDPPAVVSTWPAQGAAVAPGVLVLKVVFDQKMADTRGGYSRGPDGEMPQCLDQGLLRGDGKTFVLLCRTQPDTRYSVALNASEGGFASLGRRSAMPYVLSFSTGKASPVFSLPQAMRAASLPDTESPIRSAPPAPAAVAARARWDQAESPDR